MIRKIGVVALLFIALLVAAPAESPVRLSYVYSDSMESTLDTDDGYLLVPTDGVETGEVVTFYSAERGEYVTHRVVGESEQGFITKGDNNDATDQASGHPHVRREHIVGEPLTVGGTLVVVPGLGSVVTGVQRHRTALLVALGVLWVVGWDRSGQKNARQRSVPRVRDVFLPLFLVALLSTTGLVVWGGHVEPIEVVVTPSGSAHPDVVAVNESHERTLSVNRSASPFTTTVVGARDATITDRNRNETAVSARVRFPPQDETGSHTASLLVYRYPAVLPDGVLRQLQGIHPAVAATTTTVIASIPLYLMYLVAFDGATPVRPSRRRWLHGLEEGER